MTLKCKSCIHYYRTMATGAGYNPSVLPPLGRHRQNPKHPDAGMLRKTEASEEAERNEEMNKQRRATIQSIFGKIEEPRDQIEEVQAVKFQQTIAE